MPVAVAKDGKVAIDEGTGRIVDIGYAGIDKGKRSKAGTVRENRGILKALYNRQ